MFLAYNQHRQVYNSMVKYLRQGDLSVDIMREICLSTQKPQVGSFITVYVEPTRRLCPS